MMKLSIAMWLLGLMYAVRAALGAPPPVAAATTTIEPGSPKAAVLALIEAADTGDAAHLRPVLHVGNEDERTYLDAVMGFVAVRAQFEREMRTRFGAAAEGQPGVPWLVSRRGLTDARVDVDRDRAVVQIPTRGGERGLELHRQDGQWRVGVATVATGDGGLPVDEPLRRLSEMTAVVADAIDGVRAGRYATATEAATAAAGATDRAMLGRDAQ